MCQLKATTIGRDSRVLHRRRPLKCVIELIDIIASAEVECHGYYYTSETGLSSSLLRGTDMPYIPNRTLCLAMWHAHTRVRAQLTHTSTRT